MSGDLKLINILTTVMPVKYKMLFKKVLLISCCCFDLYINLKKTNIGIKFKITLKYECYENY